MLNFLNKRKREIERLNSVIQKLNVEKNISERVFLNMKFRQSELEREIKSNQVEIYNLKNEISYLKMQLKTAKDNESAVKFY